MTSRKSVILPIVMTCLGYFLYNLSDAGSKTLTHSYHWSQIVLTNSACTATFMGLLGWLRDGKKAFRTSRPGLVLLHACLAQVATFGNIMAFSHMPLTTFYTLVFTTPFWIALISARVLGEKLDKHRVGAILFGFLVIAGTFRPGAETLDGWAMLILFGAVVYAGRMVMLRHLGAGESVPLLFIVSSAMSMIIATFCLGDHFIAPTPGAWAIFAGIMLVVGTGMLCVTYGIHHAPSAATVAPYHYTQIVWGAILGYMLFNEMPSSDIIVGAVLIVASGIYLITSETRRLRKPAAHSPQAS